MRIDIFKPVRSEGKDKYAVAVPTSGPLAIIEKCPSEEQLTEAYRRWYDHAVSQGITKPVPIELLDSSGKCKVLTDMLISPERN